MNAPSLLMLAVAASVACQCGKKPPETVVAPPPVVIETPVPAKPPEVQEVARNFERVFFEFDATTLNAESKAALSDNVSILQKYPDLKVEIQGHADERGTTDYNLALGEQRAAAIRAYLTAAGVPASRVTTITYGEERPIDPAATEVAWAQNRRAEFRITWSPTPTVTGTVP